MKLSNNTEKFGVKHISFPSIEQYRTAIKNVHDTVRYKGKDENGKNIYDPTVQLPKITFEGTIKLHGTNAGIVFFIKDGEIYVSYQSRERLLSLEHDNSAFMFNYKNTFNNIDNVLKFLHDGGIDTSIDGIVRVYGEWCGGNIQGKVALNQLSKRFVVFSVNYNDVWLSSDDVKKFQSPEFNIDNIYNHQTWNVEIDFENPENVQNTLVEITEGVELKCPYGAAFGVEGIGEGVVWKPIDPRFNSSKFWFKVKGEKHQSSKTKTLAPVDIEKVNSINEFVDNVLTESRLSQGIEKLRENGDELTVQNVGKYLKWINTDVLKEESDTMIASGIEPKNIFGPLNNKAKKYYFEVINKIN